MEIYHHGIKGQKWGVRRYQYADGTYTPAGKKRYSSSKSKLDKTVSIMSTKVKDIANEKITRVTGKQYVDGYLKENITLSRIQTSKNFENYAFYATYKKNDQDKYLGLFGKNLANRQGNDVKVYQLKLNTTKKLKIPSDENASHITANLLKEPEFKRNVVASIQDSKEKMKRPRQKLIFNQAQNALNKEPDKMTSSEKIAIYKALNLSLVNHNPQEVAAQNRFYSELKKKGYNALLDYNDKEYSSYHAKRPMIVFDTDSVRLNSVTETNPKVVNKLYKKYNTERIAKEIPANTVGYITKLGAKSLSECYSYVSSKMDDYLSD